MTATGSFRRSSRATAVVILAVVLGSGLLTSLQADGLAAGTDRAATTASEASIEQLIESLGAPEFAQREKARDQLRHLGVAAFEALHAAQYHADVEIRKQAEYLLRAIHVSWTQEDDPDEVKALLERYQQEGFGGRNAVLEQLARIDHGQSLAALCRLARFETSEVLSKRAALTVVQYDFAGQQVDAKQLIEQIERTIGRSQRSAAGWLRAHARSLLDPNATLEDWRKLIALEVDAVRQHPDKDHLGVVQDLLRWQIEMLQRLGRHDDTLAALRHLLPLQGGTRVELADTIEWLIDREAWPLIDELVKAFPVPFQEDAFLLYRRAEAALHQGLHEQAQAFADQALAKKTEDDPDLHRRLGLDLQHRGMIDWAEREYRHAIEPLEQGTHSALEAAIRLGWMFHDLSRHREAHEVFKQLTDLMAKNRDVVRRLQELGQNPRQVHGQMHFSRALELADLQQWNEHRAKLEESLKFDPENADIVIAMHRVPDADDEWRQKTQRRVELLREQYAQQVGRAERDVRANPGLAAPELAQALNQYAWLVSNTVGDYPGALKSSLRSIELAGEHAGYLDTLARCYYALGDYATALKHQRRAVELEPHTGQIRRQLELFEQTVNERGPGIPQPAPSRARPAT